MKNEKIMCARCLRFFTRLKIVFSFFIFHLSFFILLTGCEQPKPQPNPVDDDPKVFIMYDNIDNYYDKPFTANVNAAGKAVAAGTLIEGQRVVVFHRLSGGNVIYELVRDKSKKEGFSKKELKKYAPGVNNEFSKETVAAVVGDIRRDLAPANHYGFAFGSHGKGWIPKINPVGLRRYGAPSSSDPLAPLWAERENPLTRYLSGYGRTMDIQEFADALDGEEGNRWEWDFILFDDCFMACVEALYEIRDLAHYFIASPTEIMMAGFPYDRVVSVLFNDWTNYAGVADAFVEAYRTGKMEPGYPHATIAVVKADELEALAATVRNIARSGLWTDVDPTVTPIQFYEGLRTHVFFDFNDYIRHGISPDSDQYKAFAVQLLKTVVFADHTDEFFTAMSAGPVPATDGPLPIDSDSYSGLNVFIPYPGTLSLMPNYRQTEWYKDVYAE